MKPKVSILLAVYNGEKYLRRSLESVLNQTYKNFEILIGFNGTIDKSKEIVDEYKDKRIRVFDYGVDKGKAKTLNKLIREAKGEWLAIQDDDDIWLPKKLEKQLENKDFDIIGTQIFYINENDDITGGPKLSLSHDEIVSNSLNGNNQIANSSAIFKKEKAVEVSGWDETIDGIEDFDFWLKMIIFAKCKCLNLNKQHVWHRLHQRSNFNTNRYDIQSLIKKYK
jgi:glycosyltransferase involved in cell wall biosynthesis